MEAGLETRRSRQARCGWVCLALQESQASSGPGTGCGFISPRVALAMLEGLKGPVEAEEAESRSCCWA